MSNPYQRPFVDTLAKRFLAEQPLIQKSGRKKSAKGLSAFCAQVPQALRVIITLDNFAQFSSNPRGFLQQVAM